MTQLTPEGHRPGRKYCCCRILPQTKLPAKAVVIAFETKTPEKPLRFKGVLCLRKPFAYSAISGFSF